MPSGDRDNSNGGDFSNPAFNKDPALRPAAHNNLGHFLAQELRKNIKIKKDILSNPNVPKYLEKIRNIDSEIDKLVSEISKNKQQLEIPEKNRTGRALQQAEADMNAYNNALKEYADFSAQLPKDPEPAPAPRVAPETQAAPPPPVVPSARIPSYTAAAPTAAAINNMRVNPARTVQFQEPSTNSSSSALDALPIIGGYTRQQIDEMERQNNARNPVPTPRVAPVSSAGVADFIRQESTAAREEANRRLGESAQRSTSNLINRDMQRDARAVEDTARAQGNTSAALQGVQQGRERQQALDVLPTRAPAPAAPASAATANLLSAAIQRANANTDATIRDAQQNPNSPSSVAYLASPNVQARIRELESQNAQAEPAPLTRENLESLEEPNQPLVNNRHTAESVRSGRTMHTDTLNNFANALGAQEQEKRLEMTNPYLATEAKRNPEEIKAMRDQLRAENQTIHNNALDDVAPELMDFNPQDIPANVDVEAGSRDQLIKMMMGLLKHNDSELPIAQMFAAEDPNKVLGDEQLMDFLKARYNLNDPRKLQEFLGNINANNSQIGNTFRSLMDEESIMGKTKPYLDAGTAPITSESLNEFSNPNIEHMNKNFRRQALERFKEEAEERRQNFMGNLHSQYGGNNWFSSQRTAAEKQFNDAELRQKRDLEDRLMREEALRAQHERELGANLMTDYRKRNLAGSEQVGKTSSLSNITRAAAAQNLQNFNEMQEGKHLGAINQRRDLGTEYTARDQSKLNSRIMQKKAMEAANRAQPAAVLNALNPAPFPQIPYAQQPLYTPQPLQRQVGHNEYSNVRATTTPTPNPGQDVVQRGVDIVRNVLGA